MSRKYQTWLPGLLLPSALFAQLQVDSFTIAGGGGTRTGGGYSISDTTGQPDAGPTMTNGQFALTGGFWALPEAVQSPGLPVLIIGAATPGYAQISWTPSTTNFVLQETTSLAPTNWVNAPSGTTNLVTVPANLPKKFYRLIKP